MSSEQMMTLFKQGIVRRVKALMVQRAADIVYQKEEEAAFQIDAGEQ
jgi:hypothetical protein